VFLQGAAPSGSALYFVAPSNSAPVLNQQGEPPSFGDPPRAERGGLSVLAGRTTPARQ
jgi:hypothetical protein